MSRWYAVVGSYLTLTVLVDVATPILFTLIKVSWSKVRRRRWFTQWKLTQDDLDKLFIGPRFNLATRISSVLTTAFVAMMFCGGLPLLVPIAACGFTAQYWVRRLCACCDNVRSCPLNCDVNRWRKLACCGITRSLTTTELNCPAWR